MDYQKFRPMTVPSKTRRTFKRNTFAEHNYNYAHSSKTNYPHEKLRPPKPRKTFTRSNFAEHNYNYTHPSKANHSPRKTNNKHVCSHYWDKPMTTYNSVNFQSNQNPP